MWNVWKAQSTDNVKKSDKGKKVSATHNLENQRIYPKQSTFKSLRKRPWAHVKISMVSVACWEILEADLEMENKVQEAHWGVFPGPIPMGEEKEAGLHRWSWFIIKTSNGWTGSSGVGVAKWVLKGLNS